MSGSEPLHTGSPPEIPEIPARERILHAAFSAFMEHGYSGTSTLQIATRAHVSKRELYTLFGNKQAILAACIKRRVERMRARLELSSAGNREGLIKALKTFGAAALHNASSPVVLGVYRLAIAESARAPEVAQTLNTVARNSNRAIVATLIAEAQSAEFLGPGDPQEMAEQFFALLWGEWMMQLLLRVSDPPTAAEIEQRVQTAAAAFLRLHGRPVGGKSSD